MPSSDDAKARLLEAAVAALMEQSPEQLTVGAIADRAECAKGLVHYHFKKKDALLAEAAGALWHRRTRGWTGALGRSRPAAAIDGAWDVLTTELDSGLARAAIQLAARDDDLIGRSARKCAQEFREGVTSATGTLLERMGRTPTVPLAELGQLLVATIAGLTVELEAGADRGGAAAAWAAFWVGLLALSE